jgi:hypothetical protein
MKNYPSFGIVSLPEDSIVSSEELIRAADGALYAASTPRRILPHELRQDLTGKRSIFQEDPPASG